MSGAIPALDSNDTVGLRDLVVDSEEVTADSGVSSRVVGEHEANGHTCKTICWMGRQLIIQADRARGDVALRLRIRDDWYSLSTVEPQLGYAS